VRRLFPKDAVLQEMRAESYLGTTLWNSHGQPIGLIALIGSQPLADTRTAESILQLVAVRAAGELERTQAEQALRASEERFRKIYDNAATGIAISDQGGRFVQGNAAYRIITGYTEAELAGMTFASLIHPEDRESTLSLMRRLRSEEIPSFETENRYIHKNGGSVWVHQFVSFLRDNHGQPTHIVALVTDVTVREQAVATLREAKQSLEEKVQERTTELAQTIDQLKAEVRQRRQAEQQLRVVNEQLLERAAQLRWLASELTLAEQRERRRIAKLLHDHLQQLLVGAKYHLSVLGSKGAPSIKKGAAEIDGLLAESIEVSRSLTAELFPPVMQDGDLPAGLQWLVRWMADNHGLQVSFSQDDEIPYLPEDVRIVLFESVRELLFNAVKHARTTTAAVELRHIQNQELCLSVCDAGTGFDFDRVRLSRAKGSGLGLFNIRERLDLIGGSLEIITAPGQGSKFLLSIPLNFSQTGGTAELIGAIRADVESKVRS
jgi:PAS domain S-box-containing protein